MKRTSAKILIKISLLATVVMASVWSCRKESPIIPDPGREHGTEAEPSYKVIEGSYQTYRNCDFEDILTDCLPGFRLPEVVNVHTLVSVIKSLKLEKRFKIPNIDHVMEVLSDTTTYGSLALQYRSVDLSGKERWLSGRIFFPIDRNSSDPVPIRHPDHFLLACHHTVSSEDLSPSNTRNVLECLLPQQGGLVIVPDYLGFGSSNDIPHPYCHPISGRNGVDMLLSVREFCRDRGLDTNSIPSFVEGYSEGGYSALAAVKYICQNSLQDTLKLKNSICGGGPYSHIAVFDRYIDENECPIPIAVPFLIVSYKTSFPEILTEDYDRYFSRELIDAGVVDTLLNRRCKQFEVDGIISRACNPNGSDKYPRTDRILGPEAIDRGSEIYNQITECGRRCDLTEGWTISTPVRFFHGEDDEVVSSQAVMKVKENLSNEFTDFEILDNYPEIAEEITGLCSHMFYGLVFYFRMICGDYKN